LLSSSWATAISLGALALFAFIGIRGARRFGVTERDPYLAARGSQTTGSLALSFFASALGAWILIAPPQVGALGLGLLGVLGYAVGQAAAIAAFAYLGPKVRRWIPEGTTILDFVGLRFGRVFRTYVSAVSVLYMFVFLVAELASIGLVGSLLSRSHRLVPIILVASVTAAYTAYGGLPASIRTDRWQAAIVIVLILYASAAIFGDRGSSPSEAFDAGLGHLTRPGAETAVVLVIAIVAANLFHQGFWQRVWASRDDRVLRRGVAGGAALIAPVVFLTGFFGMVAAGGGRVEVGIEALAFFNLVEGAAPLVLGGVLGLAIALVASTVDTLQNACASLAAVDVAGGRLSLRAARWITVALTAGAVVLAARFENVLRIFLVADLLAATIALPVFLGLWRRTTTAAALSGSLAGLVGIVGLGWVRDGSLQAGLLLLTVPGAVPRLGPFVMAPLASGATTLLVALASRRRTAGGAEG
jgi:SSS family solute:Na+ symporter